MSTYTLEKITKVCSDIANKYGFTLAEPVLLNNRLSTTLGRVCYKGTTSRVMVDKIEFNKKYVENADDAAIYETIVHEMCHYLATKSTLKKHGHDEYWKSWMVKCGQAPERCYSAEEGERLAALGAVKARKIKYVVKCSKCGQTVAERTRTCPLVKNPETFFTKCCKAECLVYSA